MTRRIASPSGDATPRRLAPLDHVRRAWEIASFGIPHARRRIAVLAALGVVAGLGETAVVLLVVALVSGRRLEAYPLADQLPSSPWGLAALALGTLAGLAAAHLLAARLAARSGAEVQRAAQTALVASYLDAPWPVQVTTRTGQLQDLVTVKVNVLAFGAQETGQAVAALANGVIVVAAAIAITPYAAVALLVTGGAVVAVSRALRRRRRAVLEAAVRTSSTLAVDVTDTAEVVRDVRVFGVTAAAYERLAARIGEAAARTASARLAITASAPLTRDATVALLVVGLAVLVAWTGIGLPTVASAAVLMLRASGHAQSLAGFGMRLQDREQNLAEVEAALAAWRPRAARGGRHCPHVRRVLVQDVTYTHPGAETPALVNVSIDLRRGELLGVVGRTGSGKSTLAAVLLGLLEPDAGAVLVDGVDLRELDPTAWHARTAWVGQEPRLLAGTVRENIRFLRPRIADGAVEAAAVAAGLRGELERWPDGLDHRVGPGGGALSGGERQRVALARALAGGPDLLVLDEPTSALDAHTEAAVAGTLQALRRKLIVVVVAHRVSTVRACDRIAVLDGGRIRALAPPTELERQSPYFRQVLALAMQRGK